MEELALSHKQELELTLVQLEVAFLHLVKNHGLIY